MAFDADQFRSQLETQGLLDVPCPMCGAADWAVSPVLSALHKADDASVDLTDEQALRVATVGCKSCGFVRLHDPEPFS